MKKRIFSAVLILIMLLAIPSCSMDQLTEFMGRMNENVMGVDPENAAKAEEAIKDSTKPATGKDKETINNTITEITASLGGEDAKIEVPDTILSNLSSDAIGELANSINKASGVSGFSDSMKKPTENSEETRGSAQLVTNIVNTVMGKSEDDTTDGIPTLGDGSKIPDEQKQMLNALIDGINKISRKGSSETEGSYEPTQADAVILQMTQSVVMTIANSEAIKEADGNLENIDPTQLITAENKKMLQSAIDTINVLAPHSAFEGLNINLDSLLDSFMNGEEASNA